MEHTKDIVDYGYLALTLWGVFSGIACLLWMREWQITRELDNYSSKDTDANLQQVLAKIMLIQASYANSNTDANVIMLLQETQINLEQAIQALDQNEM